MTCSPLIDLQSEEPRHAGCRASPSLLTPLFPSLSSSIITPCAFPFPPYPSFPFPTYLLLPSRFSTPLVPTPVPLYPLSLPSSLPLVPYRGDSYPVSNPCLPASPQPPFSSSLHAHARTNKPTRALGQETRTTT